MKQRWLERLRENEFFPSFGCVYSDLGELMLLGEAVVAGDFIQGFFAFRSGDFGGVSEGNEGDDVPVGGDVEEFADFGFVEGTDPAGSDAHGPSSDYHVLESDRGADFGPASPNTVLVGTPHNGDGSVFDESAE